MRIVRLDLSRYGGFTNTSLDLSGDGLHVIVGANEAGKTTAMTAIRELFYGIHDRTPHNYLHDYRNMQLGALLDPGGGKTHEIVRLKRDVGALRGPNEDVREEAELAGWLFGVDQALYRQLFEISHEEIARGGEALLESDGDVGRAVFSAARGRTNLNGVLRTLEARAEDLYKQQGRNPSLNAALLRYKGHVEQANRLSLRAQTVTDLDDQLAAAVATRDGLLESQRDIASRRARLERIKAARPQLAERTEFGTDRDRLVAAGPLVDVIVGEQLAAAREARRRAREGERVARDGIARVDEQVRGLDVDTDLLAQSDPIARLQSASGAFQERRDDLPRRKGELQNAQAALVRLLARLPEGCLRDSHGLPALGADHEARVLELSDEYPRRDEQLEAAIEQEDRARRTFDGLLAEQARRPELVDSRALDAALARVRAGGDLQGVRRDTAKALADVSAHLAVAIARLGIGGVDPTSLDGIAVPSGESIREHRTRVEALQGDIARANELIAELQDKRTRFVLDLEALVRDVRPPSDEELAAARAARDFGWDLVRQIWRDGADPDMAREWTGAAPLDQAYEQSVYRADVIADRLRQEAGAVERRVNMESQIAACDAQMAEAHERHDSAVAAGALAEEAWAALWAPVGIVPGAPVEMETWRDAFRDASAAAANARTLATTREAIDMVIADHRADLVAACVVCGAPVPDGASFAGVVDHADGIAQDAATARDRDRELESRLGAARDLLAERAAARLERARAMDEWRTWWGEAVAPIGLASPASPAQARAVLSVIAEITATRTSRDEELGRIAGIQERNDTFVRGVAEVLAALESHRDLALLSPELVIAALTERRESAQRVATRHETLTAERARHVADLGFAQQEIGAEEARIAELIVAGGVQDEAGLADAITRGAMHAAAAARIDELERGLRQSFGRTIDELVEEAALYQGAELDPDIAAMTSSFDDVATRLDAASTLVGDLTRQRAQITASGDAAEAMEQAQQALADLVNHADDYVQTVLAKRLLEEQITAYRSAHQGPLLARAGALFAALTLQRYVGLDTDTDARGTPTLYARRANDTLLDVGVLSTGTRDQLYLALRLAALEQVIARRGPLPLVLDDLFVHFDDDRTDAGLRVLDQVSAQTQVLLFTHHSRVAEQALEAIPAGRVHVAHLAPMRVDE